MKRIAITLAVLTAIAASAALAATECQTLSDGRTVCTPTGGGSSSYR